MGFNAGNGTKAYEYRPYSQTTQIRDLPSTGGANGFPGRHIFRIDEKILPGVCIRDLREWLLHLSSLDCLQSIRIHRITKEKIKSTSPNGKVNPNNPLSSHQARPTCHWCSPPRTGTCLAAPWSTSPGPASCPAPGSPAGLYQHCTLAVTPRCDCLNSPFSHNHSHPQETVQFTANKDKLTTI